jgi:hypothetical protein
MPAVPLLTGAHLRPRSTAILAPQSHAIQTVGPSPRDSPEHPRALTLRTWSSQLGRTLKVDKPEPVKKESRAREHDAAALAQRFGEPMSRVLGWIGMDWRMDGGTWEQARNRVARRLGRRAGNARRRPG